MDQNAEQQYVEYVSARLPVLHRAAYLMCGDADRADDIVQATLLALYRHWRSARAADSIDAYVHRMLVRKYLDERRLGWFRVRLGGPLPDPGVPADRTFAGVELRDQVTAALALLPGGQRVMIVLRYLFDLSVEEVASLMGCSVGNVKSQTSRGLATLRGSLALDQLIDFPGKGRRP